MITLTINRAEISADKTELMTRGMVSAVTCRFVFSADWAGLRKTVVWRSSAHTIVQELASGEDTMDVPHEMFRSCGAVRVGVYGFRGEDRLDMLVIPTVWCELGRVVDGADPNGAAPEPYTERVYDELIGKYNAVHAVAEDIQRRADDGEFDGDTGDKGDTGDDGKSAYQSARDGGYTGTEAQFNADLSAVSSKQNALPAAVLDRVLHTNATTGALEWAHRDVWAFDSFHLPTGSKIAQEINNGRLPVFYCDETYPYRGAYVGGGGDYVNGTFRYYFVRVTGAHVRYFYMNSDSTSHDWDGRGEYDIITQHQSLAAYRTAAAQDTIDAARLKGFTFDASHIPAWDDIWDALQRGELPMYVDNSVPPDRGVYICHGGEYVNDEYRYYFMRISGQTVRYYYIKSGSSGGSWDGSGSYRIATAT